MTDLEIADFWTEIDHLETRFGMTIEQFKAAHPKAVSKDRDGFGRPVAALKSQLRDSFGFKLNQRRCF